MIDLESVRESCYGCMACINVCPKQAISSCDSILNGNTIQLDEKECINCGKCDEVCPISSISCFEQTILSCYWGFSNNSTMRYKSSSGGLFAELANEVLSSGGIIFGAIFDSKQKIVRYASTDTVPLEKIMKSKYAESYVGRTFIEIKNNLKENRKVLFCGTPCHVNGLKNYIGDNYSANLLTVDFLCHGVPSSALLKEQLNDIETKYDSIVEVDFRAKEYGWSKKTLKCIFENREPIRITPPYLSAFLNNYTLRNSCYVCPFRKGSAADITIGDFNGYKNYDPNINDEKGLSIVFLRTERGLETFSRLIDTKIFCEKLEEQYYQYAFEGDLSKDYPKKMYFELLLTKTTPVIALKRVQRREFTKAVKNKLRSYF